MPLTVLKNKLLPSSTPHPGWEDHELIAACLAGQPAGWNALIDKYKGLIFSVPLRYRLNQEDAEDVFQDVCILLYQHLETLRDAGAIRGWLARVAANESYRRKKGLSQMDRDELPDIADPSGSAPDWLAESEQQQLIRELLYRIPARCREMVEMLFYEDPPRAYQEVAKALGLAVGSIGFIRGRCLRQLEQLLKAAGI